ncbi:MAG: hypothetical protein R2827_02925 [Bdellovibrionales bacterium]
MRAAILIAFEVAEIAIKEEPDLMDERMRDMIKVMMSEAIDCEMEFAKDRPLLLSTALLD